MRRANAKGCLFHHREQAFGGQNQHRIAAAQLRGDLFDIGFAAAKAGRQRQRYRIGASIDSGKECGGKARTGFGDERDTVLRLDAPGDQDARLGVRIGGEGGIGVGVHQIGAGVMEIHALFATGGIVQRLAERTEVGAAIGEIVESGGRNQV